jgi:branched-subunit amino acid aminotransferase/4-amino-4-deoxychorismate lyase
MPWVYIHPQFVPQPEAHLALNDAGFVFGATISELCRTFRGKLYRLNDHLARFRRGCALAEVPVLPADDQIAATAQALVERNRREDEALGLAMLATPGRVGYYLGKPGGAGDAEPTLIMHTFPLPFARYQAIFREGARLVAVSAGAIGGRGAAPTIKHRSRMHWWLADRAAKRANAHAIGLLLDDDGKVLETATANVLAVCDGVVCSPPRDRILPGISLQIVEELCAELCIPFSERLMTLGELKAADEVWLSSTPFCLAPVRWLDDREWPAHRPVYERVLAHWSAAVGVDIRGQILEGVAG